MSGARQCRIALAKYGIVRLLVGLKARWYAPCEARSATACIQKQCSVLQRRSLSDIKQCLLLSSKERLCGEVQGTHAVSTEGTTEEQPIPYCVSQIDTHV